MTQYVDASALVKRYVDEPESDDARRLLLADPDWVTANHTYVEVYRVLGLTLADDVFPRGIEALNDDWSRILIVALDDRLCRRAAELSVMTATRTLDALHLAAAERAGGRAITFLTFDLRQALAARSLGYPVSGV